MSDIENSITEQPTRAFPKPPKRRQIATVKDVGIVAIVIVFIAVVAIVTTYVTNKISGDHATAAARPVADRAITAFDKRDGSALRSLGSPYFQATNSAASLTKGAISEEIATLKAPSLDTHVVVNAKDGRVVYFIYKYSALKVPFYIRVDIQQQYGHWYLTAMNGDINEGTLLTNS